MSLTPADCAAVRIHVQDILDERTTSERFPYAFLFGGERFRVLVSGWQEGGVWKRGFLISHQYSPQRSERVLDPGERYQYSGWHERMAEDIVKTAARLQKRSSPPSAS